MKEPSTSIVSGTIDDVVGCHPAVSQPTDHGGVCLRLNLVQLGLGEICSGQNIISAESVNCPVEAFGFSPGEVTSSDDLP